MRNEFDLISNLAPEYPSRLPDFPKAKALLCN